MARWSRNFCDTAKLSGLLNVQWLRAGHLAVGVGRDLVDPRLRLPQQFLAASLQGFSAFVDRNRFLQRHLAIFQSLDDGLEFFERALEAQLLDIRLCIFGHILVPDSPFRWCLIRAPICGRIVVGIHVPINAETCAATDSWSPCRS